MFAHQAARGSGGRSGSGGFRGGGSGGGGGGAGGSGSGSGGGSGSRGGGGSPPSREPAHLADAKRQHREHAEAARNTPMEGGWETLAIERRLTTTSGRTIQPDAVYVNHDRKIVVI